MAGEVFLSFMNILGIHIGHDSSAALVRDGRIVADVAGERFVRTKHYCGLPIGAIEYCLKSQNLTISDIDAIAIPTAYPVPDLNFLFGLEGARQERPTWKRQGLELVSELARKPASKP